MFLTKILDSDNGFRLTLNQNSKIDFEKLREDFGEAKYKNIEIADLHVFIEDKLRQMMEQNHTRVDFAQKLQLFVPAKLEKQLFLIF